MVAVKKVELSIDLTRPAEELIETIIQVLSYYPGAQLGILQRVDQTIGEMLAAMQPKEDPGPVETAEEPT
ncbi:hypothetical protein KDC22_14535 [Paenibacillus tritici]|uniref:hypothetical protein n=1 Tax=Paenibacillus tritici TaxID=1873425 RepID=UPI001BAAC7C9|nr:hypothetical protein [Paenibacillus tritici]QUL57584.1 hypothetical protein KDC22_14535 [Paenibacillus tritici]